MYVPPKYGWKSTFSKLSVWFPFEPQVLATKGERTQKLGRGGASKQFYFSFLLLYRLKTYAVINCNHDR
jgi:hypothetical protein